MPLQTRSLDKILREQGRGIYVLFLVHQGLTYTYNIADPCRVRFDPQAEAKRALEDAIFDAMDNDDASSGAKAEAEEAEAWLVDEFDSASAAQIREKAMSIRRRK